jgi:NAD(P)-dependent dehydrogenase (short-subunit alcohol dehydrogenase family)
VCHRIKQVEDQFNVNVLGPLRTIRAVLPSMRARKSGTIVNITSANGLAAMPGLGVYSASKFALEGNASSSPSLHPRLPSEFVANEKPTGLTEGLQLELAPFDIRVLLVEPGMVATNLANPKGSGVIVPLSEPYKATMVSQAVEGVLGAYAAGLGASAEKTALRITEAVDGTGLLEGKDVKLRLLLGSDAAEVAQKKGQQYLDLFGELKDVWASI